jgi:hypothetical protein
MKKISFAFLCLFAIHNLKSMEMLAKLGRNLLQRVSPTYSVTCLQEKESHDLCELLKQQDRKSVV